MSSSSGLNYKQVANVKRRTWDLEAYSRKAKERQEKEEGILTSGVGSLSNNKNNRKRGLVGDPSEGPVSNDVVVGEEKEEFVPAVAGAAGPVGSQRAFLQARSHRVVDIDTKVGTTEIISSEAAARTCTLAQEGGAEENVVSKTGIGWHCKVCDCFLKDSHTYLDHINGRKHQRALGYSMRVERSTKDQLLGRLKALAEEKEKQQQIQRDKEQKQFKLKHQDTKQEQRRATATYDDEEQEEDSYYQDIVKQKDEQQKKLKEQRRQRRKEKKKKKKEESKKKPTDDNNQEQQTPIADNEAEEGNDDDDGNDPMSGMIDPSMAAMMGFSGFGAGNKNR